jgi:Spy/CpxP family protein refolding chaperone
MREKFEITEEQEAKLKTARRAKRDASAAIMADLGAATRKLQDQIEDKASDSELSATLDKISAIRKAERAEEDKFEAALKSILTPAQRARMALAMKARGGMGGRMGGGQRGGMHKRGGGHGKPGKDGPPPPQDDDHDDEHED